MTKTELGVITCLLRGETVAIDSDKVDRDNGPGKVINLLLKHKLVRKIETNSRLYSIYHPVCYVHPYKVTYIPQ